MEKVKYFLKGTTQEITVGDVVTNGVFTVYVTNDIALKALVSMGIAYTNEGVVTAEESMIEEANRVTVDKIRERLAKRLKLLSVEEVDQLMSSMDSVNRGLTLSTWLREIAVLLDEKYEDHISNCEEYWVFDMLQGRLKKIPKAHVKTFKYNALFRSLDDAKIACSITRGLIKLMYGK